MNMSIARMEEEESKKETEKRLAHWESVKNWTPACYCTKYCYNLRRTTGELRRSISIKVGQGRVRPMHCVLKAGSHPGYRKVNIIRNLIISFILKLRVHSS